MRTVIIILVFLFNNSPAWAQSFDRLDFRRYSNRLWRITNSVIVEADESDRSAFQVQFDYKIGSALRSMNFNAYQPRHLSSSLLWTPQMRLSDYRRASLLGQVKDVVNPENRIVYRALWSISDERLKSNVVKVKPDEIDRIALLNAYKYNYIDESTKSVSVVRYGFMAQEVKNVFPDLVLVLNDSDSILAVNYDGFIPILLESINALKLELGKLQKWREDVSRLLPTDEYSEAANNVSLLINPNPALSEVVVEFSNFSPSGNEHLLLFDAKGLCVARFQVDNYIDNKMMLDLGRLTPGVYNVALFKANKEIISTKIVKQ